MSEEPTIDGSSVSDYKKNDQFGRIRTGDLHHVKTGISRVELMCSDCSTVFSLDALASETTTRNTRALS